MNLRVSMLNEPSVNIAVSPETMKGSTEPIYVVHLICPTSSLVMALPNEFAKGLLEALQKSVSRIVVPKITTPN